MSSSSGSGETELDLRGEVCPFTFVRARLALEALPIGARLRVVVDHEPASRNVPRSAEAWGQRVESVEPAGEGLWAIALVKCVP
jgi:tRNA 2-thiouridine synthesizing protein A